MDPHRRVLRDGAQCDVTRKGIVNAPELRQKMVNLLRPLEQQHRSEMSNTIEALVVEAVQALSRRDQECAYVREIAVEVNRLLEARGETARLSPEKAGHLMKKLDLRTRPLSQAGNGLAFDNATIAAIQQLTAMYLMEDMQTETEDLYRLQATEK